MQLTVAPDYLPPHFGAWYLISGLVGQETGRPVRLHMPGDTRELEDTLARQQEGIAYVNSFSASRLIREQGWILLLKPAAGSDETVIICRADALRCLSEEERETLLEFVTQAEIAKQTGRDTAARYGLTVGEALEHQHTMQDIASSISSFSL